MLFPFDLEFSILLELLRHPFLDFIFSVVSIIGNPLFWIAVAVILYWQKKEKYSFHLINLVLASAAITFVLKHFFSLARPSVYGISQIVLFTFDNLMSDIYSFPSGHTVLATAAFAFFFDKLNTQSRLVSSLALFLIAFSRIYLGFHFLSDVLAGMAVGFVIGYLVRHLKIIEVNIKNKFLFLAILFVLFAILSFSLVFLQIKDYYNFIAFFFFFYFGYIFVKHANPVYSINNPALISFVLMFCYVLIFYFMNQNNFISVSVFGIIGLFIAFFPLLISKLFGQKSILEFKKRIIDK